MALFNFTPASILSQVSSAIDFFSGSARADAVAVFDQQTLQQIFEPARIMEIDVKEPSRVMEYPVETGATLSDHHVILPTMIDVVFFIQSDYYTEAYGAIRNAFRRARKLVLQTRTGVYSNMIIQEMGNGQKPEMFDAIMLTVRFKEVIFISPNTGGQSDNYSPLDPTMGSIIPRGLQIGSAITKQIGAALSYINAAKIFKWRL